MLPFIFVVIPKMKALSVNVFKGKMLSVNINKSYLIIANLLQFLWILTHIKTEIMRIISFWGACKKRNTKKQTLIKYYICSFLNTALLPFLIRIVLCWILKMLSLHLYFSILWAEIINHNAYFIIFQDATFKNKR